MKVTIIGAGVIGASIALQLTRSGHDVHVVERNAGAGQGSTSSSSAVVRFNYSTFDAVALAWESYFYWKKFPELLDGNKTHAQPHYSALVDCGYVMLDVPVMSLENTVALYKRAGIPYEIWDSSELKVRLPGIDAGKYWPNKPVTSPEFWNDATEELGASYVPAGGYINDPLLAAENFAVAAAKEGATFHFKKVVTGIDKNSAGRVTHITVADWDKSENTSTQSGVEKWTTDVIVNVAGPWSTLINDMAGVGSDFTIQIKPMRQEVHQISSPANILTGPIIADVDLGYYARSAPGGATLVGGTEPECDRLQWVEPGAIDQVNMVRTVELFEAQTYRFARRFPHAQIPATPVGIVGVYDVSSDWTPIYDATNVPGFYVAIGTSGNQFKNATGVGFIMTELIERVESGHNHDLDPIVYQCKNTPHQINLGTFSRKRKINENSSKTVLG